MGGDSGGRVRRAFRSLTGNTALLRVLAAYLMFILYIALAGRYDILIDARLIHTLGPGDHFGELAARLGGGYGYTRLAATLAERLQNR
jgi:CRP-like cAMP-binding protein